MKSSSGSEFTTNETDGGRLDFLSVIRDNPVPLAMLGIGAFMLMRNLSIDDSAGEMSSAAQTGRSSEVKMRTTGLIHESPIMAGVAALAVGALVGALIPETDREHELLGETRDRLAQRARELARESVHRARDMAGNATRAAAEAVKKTDVGQPVGLGSTRA